MNKFNPLQHFSIPVKIILLSASFAALFLGITYGYALLSMRAQLGKYSISLLQEEILLGAKQLERNLEEVQNTVKALSETPPLQGMIRAEKNNGYDELGTSTSDQWEKRLAAIFIAQMKARRYYDQLRFIDENGFEVVRVNRTADGQFIVPRQELQFKANRPYFLETMRHARGDVYVSEVGLNKEGDPPQIQTPYKPTLRVAVPIFDEETNKRQGILIANILFDKLVNSSEVLPRVPATFLMIDTQGYYIVNPDISMQWGSPNDLKTGKNFFSEHSLFTKEVFSSRSGQLKEDNITFIYATVVPNSQNINSRWVLIGEITQAVIFAPVNKITYFSFVVAIVTFIIFLLVFTYVIRKLLAPLKKLSDAAEHIGSGNFSDRIEVNSNDEVGRLAKSIRTMQQKLSELYKGLESKVQERTEMLAKQTDLLKESEIILKEKLDETERLNKLMVDRELKMVELKKKLKVQEQ